MTWPSFSDTVAIIALTAAGAVPVAAVAWWLTRRRRGGTARTQLVLVALAPMMATWVGATVAARGMFISSHDLTVFLIIAATAGAIGLLTAWRLWRRIERDSARLTRASRALADGEVPAPAGSRTGKGVAGVTELQHLADELSETSRRLTESRRRERALERSRRELIAWVSHDLRSPLAGIRAMAEAIEDEVVTDPADVTRYLRNIGAETDRLALLVDDLFELSQISSGIVDLQPTPVAVADLLAHVVEAAGPGARRRGVRIETAVDRDGIVVVSRSETERVLRNLVDNAVRHTPDGGRITLRTSHHDEAVTVEVLDECGGIPPSDIDRVFDIAFRGDVARQRDDGGGGLGLAIAKGLVEAQQGTIAVTNREAGCCFTVRLPSHRTTPD